MSVFLTLVKNDLGIAKNRSKQRYTFWYRLYTALAILFAFILYTFFLLNAKTHQDFVTFLPVFFLISSFPIAIQLLKREWHEKTVGWWLQFPYSRKLLLGAKITAGYIFFLKRILIAVGISLLLWFEEMLLRPDLWVQFSFPDALLQLGILYLLILFISPLLMVLGMLIALIAYSTLKPVAPIFWAFFGMLMSFLFSSFFSVIFKPDSATSWSYAILGLGPNLTLGIGVLVALLWQPCSFSWPSIYWKNMLKFE